MILDSTKIKTSRYTQGGLTEKGTIGIEWWGKFNLPSDDTDLAYTVNKNMEHRIDKIANAFYGDPTLWWVIAQFNNILDPYDEIIEGRVLFLPTHDRLQMLLTSKMGGINTTRNNESILPPIVL